MCNLSSGAALVPLKFADDGLDWVSQCCSHGDGEGDRHDAGQGATGAGRDRLHIGKLASHVRRACVAFGSSIRDATCGWDAHRNRNYDGLLLHDGSSDSRSDASGSLLGNACKPLKISRGFAR